MTREEIRVMPFDWNDNMSEIAQEDFSPIQKSLSYGTAQTIGLALAKLELLEKQGCKVEPKAEQKAILDKIKAEIWEEAEWAYSNFDEYKEIVLEAEPDELPDDEFRFGLHRAVEIINKYKAESEK